MKISAVFPFPIYILGGSTCMQVSVWGFSLPWSARWGTQSCIVVITPRRATTYRTSGRTKEEYLEETPKHGMLASITNIAVN